MKKYIICFIVIFLFIFTICACSSKKNTPKKDKVVAGHKLYVCKNTEETTGLKSLTSFKMEVDKDSIPIKYTVITGYGNYQENIAEYEKFCNGLKEGLEKQEEIEEYKEVAQIKVTCDDKNLEAYVTKTYDVLKIKEIEYFSAINEHLQQFINEDGTFNKESWKDYYLKESIYKGKFTCDY